MLYLQTMYNLKTTEPMKRISTISLILAISLSGIPAMAECISTDRVWDVNLYLHNMWKHGIRFIPDGTYESGGNTYTRISMTECFEYYKDDNRILSLSDGDRDVYFYLREENDIVYMLPAEDWTGFESTTDDSTPGTDKTELQLFDFNAQPGDSYMSVRTSGFMALKQKYGYKTLIPTEVHVNSTDNVVIGDKTLRRQYIDKITDPETGKSVSLDAHSMIQVIETIGIVNSGYPMAFVANASGLSVNEIVNLAECMNKDREVLWKNENIYLPELTKARPVGKEASIEYHASFDDSTHLLWTCIYGTDSEQETVDMEFNDVRKWQRNGDNVNILDPVISSQGQLAYNLVNNGRRTALRVTGNDGTTSDYPLYDFNKGRTEEFPSVMSEIEYIGDLPVLKSFTPIVCKIDSVDFYDWSSDKDKNEYVKCQHISEIYIPSTGEIIVNDENEPFLFSLLEGVGNVDYPLVYVRNGSNVKLNKIRHSRGQLILLGDNLNVPDIDHKPVKLIRPDREWEYVTIHPFGETTTFRRMKFDGTEDRYGHTYHRWITVKTTIVYHNDDFEDSYTVEIDNTPKDIFLMREENSKVYMLIPEEIDPDNYTVFLEAEGNACWNSSDINKECREMILYDFTQRTGDIVQGCVERCIPAGFSITHTDIMTVEGEECIVQSDPEGCWYPDFSRYIKYMLGSYTTYNFYDYKMIEGIGFDGWGTMTFIPIIITPNSEPNFFINNVYNSKGEVIYRGRDMYVPTKDFDSVNTVQTDKLEIKVINGDILINGANLVSIFTLEGLLVHSANTNGADAIINTKNWTKGTYIVQAIGASCNRTIKLTF